jgi:hypothetical protein
VTSNKDKISETKDSTPEILLQISTITSKEGREPERDTNPTPADANAHRGDDPFDVIIEAIETIAYKHKLQTAAKKDLEALVVYTRAAKRIEKEKERSTQTKMEVSELRLILKADLQGMYNALAHKLEELRTSHKETLEKADLVLKASEDNKGMAKELAKELEGKVGKVAEAASKMESCAMSYRDALTTKNPLATGQGTNPKVLNNIDRRVKQILIEVFDTEGESTLARSTEELLDKANSIIKGIADKGKPGDAQVVLVYKT